MLNSKSFYLWLLFISACCLTLFLKLNFSYDLGLFLPAPKTSEQKILVERLGDGPGSRFLLIGLPSKNGHDLEDELFAASDALMQTGLFTNIISGAPAPELEDIPDLIWRYRYVLSDFDLTRNALSKALKTRSQELALFAGEDFNTLLQADPTFAAIKILDRLAAATNDSDLWQTDDGAALLIAETKAPVFDMGAQKQAVTSIQDVLGDSVEISGAGAIGVGLQKTIQHEATQRSIFASVALALVLLFFYRKFSVLILAALPLLTGLLAGLAAISLFFDAVHGITLAFGFTLLGVAIDYPLHLFSHARHRTSDGAITEIWPTLRLGAASTITAYAAIALSGSQGLAQLGTFTAVGLLAAALTTRWLLPQLETRQGSEVQSDTSTYTNISLQFRFCFVPLGAAIILLLISSGHFGVLSHGLWNNSLSALSPVPADKLKRDNELRQAIGTPDLRYVISVENADLQNVLQQSELLDETLTTASQEGFLDHWQTVTRLLPSEDMQKQRQQNLPTSNTLKSSLAKEIPKTPFALNAFESFVDDVNKSEQLPLLKIEDFDKTPFKSYIENHLYQRSNGWVALTSLYGLKNPEALARWLQDNFPDATLIDFKSASENLVADYRRHVIVVLGIALLLILIVLLWRLSTLRALWCLTCVLTAVLTTTILLYVLTGPLNLYHLIALLLVAGLGLDYALFLSRPADRQRERKDTCHAVLSCATSTFVVFAMLGLSSIPALRSMGSTVAIGTLLCLGLCWFGISSKHQQS